MALGSLAALANGAIWPGFNYAFSNIMTRLSDPINNNDEINMYCLMFLMVAGAGALTTMTYTFCFGVTS